MSTDKILVALGLFFEDSDSIAKSPSEKYVHTHSSELRPVSCSAAHLLVVARESVVASIVRGGRAGGGGVGVGVVDVDVGDGGGVAVSRLSGVGRVALSALGRCGRAWGGARAGAGRTVGFRLQSWGRARRAQGGEGEEGAGRLAKQGEK
eukprot:6180808-Pleurochrysis_carterae.AAC.2